MIAVETLFVLALRVLGVWMVYTGLHALLDAVLFKLGYFNYPESSQTTILLPDCSHLCSESISSVALVAC